MLRKLLQKHHLTIVLITLILLKLISLMVKPTHSRAQESQYQKLPRRQLKAENARPFTIPTDEVLSTLAETDLVKLYGRFVSTMHILCRNQSRFGTFGDGGKEVCLDDAFKPTKPCIVYSFGSNFQFDFEMAVYKYLGCNIYTFDPSLDLKGKGKNKTWLIPTQVKFMEIGLGGRNYLTVENWQVKTLKTIMKENGHENATIDILKIDIEGYEWDAIPDILESGAYRQVKQLLLEPHFGRFYGSLESPLWGSVPMFNQLRTLRMLYEYGFGLFMRFQRYFYLYRIEATSNNEIPSQNELSFINMGFLPNDMD